MWKVIKAVAVGATAMISRGIEKFGFIAAAGFMSAAVISVIVPGVTGTILATGIFISVVGFSWATGVALTLVETFTFINRTVKEINMAANYAMNAFSSNFKKGEI